MKRLIASVITGLSILSPLAASAASPDVVKLNGTLTPATFCEGVKLDKTMTYSEWLHAFALDLKAQAQYTGQELVFRKYQAYLQQSKHVRRGQVQKCGQESANWKN